MSASAATAAKLCGISMRWLASRMRQARPSWPPALALISPITAPTKARPSPTLKPSIACGTAEGSFSRVSRCQPVAP